MEFAVPKQFKAPPYKQALSVIAACLVGMGLARLFGKSGEMQWIIASIGIVFFSWINPMLYIFQEEWLKYLGQSVIVFILMIFALLFMAKFISTDALNQHKEYQILIMLSLVFFVITSVVSKVIKSIYAFTSKQL